MLLLSRKEEISRSPALANCVFKVWLSRSEVLVGTKCNKLLLVEPEKAAVRRVHVPPMKSPLPQQPHRENCGIHCIAINPSRTMLATGGAVPEDCAVLSLPDLHHVQTMQVDPIGMRFDSPRYQDSSS